MLLADDNVAGDLFRLAAAWNGGPGNLERWQRDPQAADDPLMFIETIPSGETRAFIEHVLANLWIYRDRLGQPSPSLDALAAGRWPGYDGQQNPRGDRRACRPVTLSRPFLPVNIAVLTVSDSRTLDTDTSGDVLSERIQAAGHKLIDRKLVSDDADAIVTALRAWIAEPGIDVIITTGGTGVTGRDVTPEAVRAVADKEIPGFGELFRWLSYAKIGTSTVQSRALAAVAHGTYVFALPGSPGACKDAWDDILVHQLDSRNRPCNFVELMPRLREHLK